MALFVGRLPSNMTAYELKDLFSKYGRITCCDVKQGRILAYGFVEFENLRDAEHALKYSDNIIIGGSPIVVEFSKGQRRGNERACFKCGIEGHLARDCRKRDRPHSPLHSGRNYSRSRPSRRSEHSRTPTNSSRSRSRSRKRRRYSRSCTGSASPRNKSRSKSRSYRKSSGVKSSFLRDSHSSNERSRSRARSSKKRRASGLKRKVEEAEEEASPIRKKWIVNNVMTEHTWSGYYFVDPAETNDELLSRIKGGGFVALHGPRTSGKSTRIMRAMQQLNDMYICLYISMQSINIERTVENFWGSLFTSLKTNNSHIKKFPVINSADTFFQGFTSTEQWGHRKVVLFIDEFDRIFSGTSEIHLDFLRTIRSIKHIPGGSAVQSMVGIGTYALLSLSTLEQHSFLLEDDTSMLESPFNISEALQNPNFSKEQVKTIFKEFFVREDVKYESDIIDDIYWRTNGHASFVCICGKAIYEDLLCRLSSPRTLTTTIWKPFAIQTLHHRIELYATFKTLIVSLNKETLRPHMELLRLKFLHDPNAEILLSNVEEKRKAEHLAILAVLRAGNTAGSFTMSSPLFASIIQQNVLPFFYPARPSTSPSKDNGLIVWHEALKAAVSIFDKETFTKASIHSHKTAPITVNGRRGQDVPRESVYQQELVSIIGNWLRMDNYIVEGQCNSRFEGEERDKYLDLMVVYPDALKDQTSGKQRVAIIEFLASESWSKVLEHYDRTIKYAKSHEKNFAIVAKWTVHFTCEDNYLDDPYWPPKDRLDKGLGAIVIWHNVEFTEALMSVRKLNMEPINKIQILLGSGK